jgi:hypothetical protein
VAQRVFPGRLESIACPALFPLCEELLACWIFSESHEQYGDRWLSNKPLHANIGFGKRNTAAQIFFKNIKHERGTFCLLATMS